jgi:fructose-specific phosphotransferase system IIC component
MRNRVLMRGFLVFTPVVVAATIVIALVYAVGQQNLRIGANDPQVQMAEDAAARLVAGATPASVIPPQRVDIGQSLAPFLIVFGHDGQPLASSASLDGQLPTPPNGVFGNIPAGGRHEITWAPRSDVRQAAVIVAYRDGFVLAGRSLRLVEQREDALGQLTVFFFIVMVAGTGVAALITSWVTLSPPASSLNKGKSAA